MKALSRLAIAATALFASVSASAAIISAGDFSINMQEKIFTAPAATTVSAGVELDSTTLVPTGANAYFTGAISIDVSDVDQTIRLFVTETFSGGTADFRYVYASLDNLALGAALDSVSFLSDTLLANPNEVARNLSFTADSISLTYDYDCCALIQQGGEVVLSYTTVANAVPEPGSLALGLTAGGLLVASRRRRA
jgi:hypothetical protein